NAKLKELLGILEVRNGELKEINLELEREVTQRQRTEKALRQSEEKLRDLSHRVLHLQEEERTRISRELHDDVGQLLTAINMSLAMLKRDAGTEPETFDRKVTKVQQMVEQTMDAIHQFER